MNTNEQAGVRRALANVRSHAEATLRAVADAEAALGEADPARPLLPVAAGPLTPDPLRTPAEVAEMVDEARATDDRCPWVRFVPSNLWRQVEAYTPPDPDHGRREWALQCWAADGCVVELVEPATTLPAYAAAEFDRACEQERVAVTDIPQRALDFGHDDPAAA